MATRCCVYKDCGYYYSVHGSPVAKGEWTMFSFPKQPERVRIWLENAQVHPKIPQNQRFLCSKHFDTKFISSNKNRTLLVGEAVPFPYINEKDTDQDEECSAAQADLSIELSDEELDELILEAVSTSMEPKKDMGEKIETNLESPAAKRPRESTNVPQVAREPPSTEISSPADFGPDQIEAIDTSEVSVFQFKGEEYVQMSMEFYMLEKRKMAKLVEEYKRTLRSIKDQVSRLDL
ncbi:uncharacterized protein Dlip2 [Drosophila kikkawai]|uniref:Uncharacterized protein Dlip2 n=1 Tax=Drosophila kikkawai TaxID=30033 RepID=A0A6P4J941_DROKI|nr:uncharacterized protein LOC108080771 [Drosophila kikkawai]